MKFMVLIYNDENSIDTLPEGQFDEMMRDCLAHADELKLEGRLLDSQMLESVKTAKTMRVRNGRMTTVDGPYAEAKEVLGGFNLIEAENMEEALTIAALFPWSRTGSVEVRPVRDIAVVRKRVGAAEVPAAADSHGAHRQPA